MKFRPLNGIRAWMRSFFGSSGVSENGQNEAKVAEYETKIPKKIAFLGASVTAQTYSRTTGELTGYVEAFKNNHSSALGFEEVIVHSYPGNRLADAGLILAKKILRQKPDIVILELTIEDVSRGLDFDDRHLSHLYRIFVSKRILPVFLALPKPNGIAPYGNPAYERVKKFADANNLPLCVIEFPDDIERSEYYRDTCHTTTAGADFYANSLARFLDGPVVKNWKYTKVDPRAFRFIVRKARGAKFHHFKSIIIQNITPTEGRGTLYIIQQQKIGSFSPVVDIEVTMASGESIDRELSIWDPYCHYPRDSHVTLIELDQKNFEKIVIQVSPRLPNYAISRGDFDYTTAQKNRYMSSDQPFWLISDYPVELTIRTR